MRYCRNCRKWNAGWPFRCRYCAAGLEGRLCPSGHVNPPDSTLVFCGECGKPLEKKWGAGFSIKPYLLASGVVMVTLILAAAVASGGNGDAPLLNAVVVLGLLIFGLRLAFQILPPWVGRALGDAIGFFMRLVFGTGLKGKK